ncbi:MAG: sterol-binding protein [Alphaproteobacteria bacterium HGW-Alphaproteobacteria-5]|nr:MAG: sterol-binding protein [Alphaproteobacteria bacterium HGW-Alphaproteobacteria-5]
MSLAPSLPLRRRFVPHRSPPPSPLRSLVQPILSRVVRDIARTLPELFGRLGPHRHSRFLIDARDLPFLLLLRPDPDRPELVAWPRRAQPPHDTRISGRFRDLMGLIDAQRDGDALFFSRDLDISGDLEAVVCLRNAIDDVEGSIADRVADSLGPASRIVWSALRRRHERSGHGDGR